MRAAASGYKVAVLGAAGGIGQPLSLLLKMNPMISELSLYDVARVKGVAVDIEHCNTGVAVQAHEGEASLGECLEGADLVVIPAGVPRKPGMTRDDLFNTNAGIVKSLAEACAAYCPEALINLITNPVNSTLPIAAEVLKSQGTYDPRRVFGVSTLDIVRANTFLAQKKGLNVADVDVPVIGGHSGATILPLFSQATPDVALSDDETRELIERTQNAGTEVVEAKEGGGSATLSMAYAAARFVESCLLGLEGTPDVMECSFVPSSVTDLPFFASRVRLGPNGAEEVLPPPEMSQIELEYLHKAKDDLRTNIDSGLEWARSQTQQSQGA